MKHCFPEYANVKEGKIFTAAAKPLGAAQIPLRMAISGWKDADIRGLPYTTSKIFW